MPKKVCSFVVYFIGSSCPSMSTLGPPPLLSWTTSLIARPLVENGGLHVGCEQVVMSPKHGRPMVIKLVVIIQCIMEIPCDWNKIAQLLCGVLTRPPFSTGGSGLQTQFTHLCMCILLLQNSLMAGDQAANYKNLEPIVATIAI